MKRTPTFLLAACLFIWTAWAVGQQRTARVASATVVRVAGSPPRAEVALAFTAGLRPACLIVDVQGEQGSGSTTVYGDHDTITVVLGGPPGAHHTVTITASSRVLGHLQSSAQVFTG